MKETRLSENDEIILVLTEMLGDEASALRFAEKARTQKAHPVAIGTIHATLLRLEKRGLITSVDQRSDGERKRRIYKITGAGQRALEEHWKLHGI